MDITRRDLLKAGMGAAAASILPAHAGQAHATSLGAGGVLTGKYPLSTDPSPVLIAGVSKGASDAAIALAVRHAAEAATDFSWLNPGDTVLIKPVNNSGEKYPATTHPASIASMAALLKEKGAGRVIVIDTAGIAHVKLSEGGVRGSTRALMHKNGIYQAAFEAGAELYFPEEHGWNAFFEDGPKAGTRWKNGIMVPAILKAVDHIVLMPRTSRHMIAGVTLGLKAAVGYMRTDSRLEYHRDAATFFEKHVGINTVPSIADKLRLTLTTATKVQTTMGPDSGYVLEPETGLVIASDNLLAHDMVSLAWLLIGRELTPASEKTGFKDPYEMGELSVSTFNRFCVFMLGGPCQALFTQTLHQYEVNTIWDDPTLNAAFGIFGTVPRVELVDVSTTVPAELLADLRQRVQMT